MKPKKLLKKLVQIPLRFHHQDLHEELAELKAQVIILTIKIEKIIEKLDKS